MKTWKITYQSAPFAHSAPHSLIVEAESKEAAFAVTYDSLTRQGHPVLTVANGSDKLDLDWEAAYTLGVPRTYPCGPHTHIRRIEQHSIVAQGRVVDGKR